jgi:hypothetical protein
MKILPFSSFSLDSLFSSGGEAKITEVSLPAGDQGESISLLTGESIFSGRSLLMAE